MSVTLVKCKWGCGKETRPGPMVNHEKTCEKNPDKTGYSLTHPRRHCKWGCGMESTSGALSVHEKYGCPKIPKGERAGPGMTICPACGMRSTSGAMARHIRVCGRKKKRTKKKPPRVKQVKPEAKKTPKPPSKSAPPRVGQPPRARS